MKFDRNNLDKMSSPYLQQHKDNPVWWQNWDSEVINYAKENNRVLFVSSGYSTCHWCHVMASEAFSDTGIAEFLNNNFVSIKIDREQRPDIDRFLMNIAVSSTGSGGWPLNVFLSPDLKPIVALTYIPVNPRGGMPGFLTVLEKVKDFYENNAGDLQTFTIPSYKNEAVEKDSIVKRLTDYFDFNSVGFGSGPKFPPHSQLLFMLYYYEDNNDIKIRKMLEKTLDVMLLKGLHDHLGGGFFRYCVDENWTIPHFEKMLYDQAYLLWIYSLAYRIFKKDYYRICAKKIVTCLEDSFKSDGLYFSALDADTDHKEGETYLWTMESLKKNLTCAEYEKFKNIYDISIEGNFEGKNHLIKNKFEFPSEIENKLLSVRKQRNQPFIDNKIVTSVNCLTGVGLMHSFRYFKDENYLKKAIDLVECLIKNHIKDSRLCHSSVKGKLRNEEFLEDYAAFTLLLSYLYEETGEYENLLKEYYKRMLEFKKGDTWIEADNPDFFEVPADTMDLSIPCSVSVANLAQTRSEILLGKKFEQSDLKDPMNSSFLNISSLITQGDFYIISNPVNINWSKVPVNIIQVRSDKLNICCKNSCKNELPDSW